MEEIQLVHSDEIRKVGRVRIPALKSWPTIVQYEGNFYVLKVSLSNENELLTYVRSSALVQHGEQFTFYSKD